MTKFKCAVCGKITAGRKPKHGNLTYMYPRRHKVNGVPCKGNIQEAEWVEEYSLKEIYEWYINQIATVYDMSKYL